MDTPIKKHIQTRASCTLSPLDSPSFVYPHLLLPCFSRSHPHFPSVTLLYCLPPGTGKTIYIKAGLELLDKAAYNSIETAFSAQTNANQVQDIIDNKLDKR